MSSAVWWMLFGTPLAAAVLSCAGRFRDWRSTTGRVGQLFAVALATIAALYGCGSLVYVEVVGPMPPLDYRVEEFGLLLSLLAVIAGIVALRSPTVVFEDSLGRVGLVTSTVLTDGLDFLDVSILALDVGCA